MERIIVNLFTQPTKWYKYNFSAVVGGRKIIFDNAYLLLYKQKQFMPMTQELSAIILDIGIFFGIFFATILLGYLFNRIFKKYIQKSSIIIRNDPTNYQFLRHAISGLIHIIGFSLAIFAIPELKTVASSLLAGAGILAVAVGFASQHALSNVISGLFIVIFKPFRVNDRLRIKNNLSGIVEDITLRHTVIRDFENRRILIPNTVISDEVIINSDFGDDRICLWFEIKVSFETDLDLAKKIIAEEAIKHPLMFDNRTTEEIAQEVDPVKVRVLSIDDYSIRLRAWIWTNDTSSAFEMKCDLLETIARRFLQEGVEIPYPHRTVIEKQKKVVLVKSTTTKLN